MNTFLQLSCGKSRENTSVMSKIDLDLDYDQILKRINRARNGLKTGEWASLLGVKPNVVTNVHGITRQKPSLEYITAVAKACGLSMDYLLWDKKSEPTKTKTKSSPPPVGNAIRIYNNVLKRTGLELDAEGQEKLFKLIQDMLKEEAELEETEDSIVNSISIASHKVDGA